MKQFKFLTNWAHICWETKSDSNPLKGYSFTCITYIVIRTCVCEMQILGYTGSFCAICVKLRVNLAECKARRETSIYFLWVGLKNIRFCLRFFRSIEKLAICRLVCRALCIFWVELIFNGLLSSGITNGTASPCQIL